MIDSLSIAGQSHDAAPRRKDDARGDAGGFSYALAAASLEKSASQSLKAHGATPDRGPAAPSGETAADARADKGDKAEKSQRDATASPPKALANERDPVAAPAKTNGAAPAAAAATAPSLAPPGAPAALAAKSVNAAAVRDVAAAKTKAPPMKTPRIQPQTPALKLAFAEILARRLEKTSLFELRLDPPEHGRVDGRLSVNDDGKAILSLTFDNQNAFDHFSRDEQALRQALNEAGLNFSAGDFIFAFRERPQTVAPQSDFAPLQTAGSADAYEPLFHADWSAGALDIRI